MNNFPSIYRMYVEYTSFASPMSISNQQCYILAVFDTNDGFQNVESGHKIHSKVRQVKNV